MKMLINGVDVSPKGLNEVNISIDKSNIEDVVSVGTDRLVFANEGFEAVQNHLTNKGYFKGAELDIVLENGFSLPYFLNLADKPKLRDYDFECAISKRDENLRFWERADALSFDLLAAHGVTFDFKEVDTVVYRTDIETQTFMLSIMAFQLSSTLVDVISEIARVVGDIANAVGLDPSDIVYAIAMGIMLLVKLALIVAALVALFTQLKELFLPTPIKLKSPFLKSLIEKGCEYLGVTVESELLDEISDVSYLGRPVNRSELSFFENIFNPNVERSTLPHPTASDRFEGMKDDISMFGGFFRWFLKTFNARVQIVGNVMRLERRDVKLGTTQGITTGLTIQSEGVVEQTPNTDEAWSRFILWYGIDSSDRYTYDNFDASFTEWATENIDNSDPDLNLVKGIRRVDIGLSLGFRKTNGLFLNQFLNEKFPQIYQLMNLITGNSSNDVSQLIPAITFFSSVNPDYSQLVTSDYFYNRPKLLVIDANGNLKPDWESKIGAEALFNNYHAIDFIGNNSFMIHTAEIMECTNEIFVNLLNNDFAEINGVVCEVTNVVYNEYQAKATITYKKPSNYANTVQLIKVG